MMNSSDEVMEVDTLDENATEFIENLDSNNDSLINQFIADVREQQS